MTLTPPASCAASTTSHDGIRAIEWAGDHLRLLDQRALPQRELWLEYRQAHDVAAAISALIVRGAPAIGVAGAYAVVLAAQALLRAGQAVSLANLAPDLERLREARPTAVNLAAAVERMRGCLERAGALTDDAARVAALESEARALQSEDLAANRRMGALGAQRIRHGSSVLTVCNTGSLATAGYGTALGVIRAGYESGAISDVYACETRPWLQGARLTMWELNRDRIPAQLIADAAGAHLLSTGRVQWLIAGADRICANGDTANKIGTCQLAIAARYYGVKVMIVASSTTIDLATASGAGIPIELRDPRELTELAGQPTAAPGSRAFNPVFDVTPAALIDLIVTERGVIEAPFEPGLRGLFASA